MSCTEICNGIILVPICCKGSDYFWKNALLLRKSVFFYFFQGGFCILNGKTIISLRFLIVSKGKILLM